MSEILGVLLKCGCMIGPSALDDDNKHPCYDVAVQTERMREVFDVLARHGHIHETNADQIEAADYWPPFYISDTNGVKIKIIPMDITSCRACILATNAMEATIQEISDVDQKVKLVVFDMFVSAFKMALTYK